MAEQNTSINGSTEDPFYSESTPEEWEREEFFKKKGIAESYFVWIISVVEIPVVILTLFALCVLIKSNRSAPVFVVHLILSDLIQIICKLMVTSKWLRWPLKLISAYCYSIVVGLYFMACVAVERYVLVSHPIWYKSHNSLKVSCVISVIIWFVPLIFADVNSSGLYFTDLPLSIACFIPYPIIILCFVGTCLCLSRTISLTPLKRKLILGSLFLVLVTYTFLILPYVILNFIIEISPKFWGSLSFVKAYSYFDNLLFLNPLADCILYLFLRPDVGGLMKCVHCCCRTDTHQNSTHSRDEHSRDRSATFACCVSVPKPASHSRTACSSV